MCSKRLSTSATKFRFHVLVILSEDSVTDHHHIPLLERPRLSWCARSPVCLRHDWLALLMLTNEASRRASVTDRLTSAAASTVLKKSETELIHQMRHAVLTTSLSAKEYSRVGSRLFVHYTIRMCMLLLDVLVNIFKEFLTITKASSSRFSRKWPQQ